MTSWRIWYLNDKTRSIDEYEGSTYEEWLDLPEYGVVALRVYPGLPPEYGEFYFATSENFGAGAAIVCATNMTRQQILRGYRDASIKIGVMVQMHLFEEARERARHASTPPKLKY